MNDYQTFLHRSRYARWLDYAARRETWPETVQRYVEFVVKPLISDPRLLKQITEAILNLEVMPSMRALMTAGRALDRTHVAGYNCAYLPVDHPKAFDEAMYVLLCGTGVGFSVEQKYTDKLPLIPATLEQVDDVIFVPDSKEGWAKSLRKLIQYLFNGEIPKWDTSRVRAKGERLKTFGGRASGPAPLIELFNLTVNIFKGATGRKLSSLECHDIMCAIGNSVVVGGVRRSAMISLSDVSDDKMRYAKSGNWFDTNSQRGLANNSSVYNEKPTSEQFLREWTALVESKSGERGIFNRQAAKAKVAENGRRNPEFDFGCNPCSEIILRPYQFCNLTEVVCRAGDTAEDLHRKVNIATILGTIQSTLTEFPYLRKVWQKNTEEERLLGVSLTGIMDCELTGSGVTEELLVSLKESAISMNKVWAEKLDIPQSTAITCVKPSGTVSQLVDSASGIHCRHSEYYIRTVRADNTDPMTEFMESEGIPSEPCVYNPDTTTVFSFPMKAPEGAVLREDVNAISQLKMWLMYQEHWCEHKPSVTVSVAEHEWLEVGSFVYEHFDKMSGVSFLPLEDHVYQQAPYIAVGKLTYDERLAKMPKAVEWKKLSLFETTDNTAGSQTMACSGNSCEIVDLTK